MGRLHAATLVEASVHDETVQAALHHLLLVLVIMALLGITVVPLRRHLEVPLWATAMDATNAVGVTTVMALDRTSIASSSCSSIGVVMVVIIVDVLVVGVPGVIVFVINFFDSHVVGHIIARWDILRVFVSDVLLVLALGVVFSLDLG